MSRRFWAPGRVNLIGEHTDYSGGLVLPVAIDLGIRVDVEAAARTSLVSDVADPAPYVTAVEAELAALGRPDVGIAGRIDSTLPVGAGLASSAALEVAIGTALCAVADFELEPLELAAALQRAERRASGVPCGIMDQAASLLGRAGHALLLDTGTLEHRLVPLPPGVAIVIVDSRRRRRLADSAYEQRRRELEEGHERRLRHVRTENERVREIVAALERTPPDLGRVGELLRAGHESLRHDFEVSTTELDLLVELAYDHGAVGARMTGAGFGGSIVALVHEDEAEAFASACGTHAAAYVTTAADGAREL